MKTNNGKAVSEVWTFASDSTPGKQYETMRYADGSTSCNCPGWTRRVDLQGERSCRHTRSVHMGVATRQAVAHTDYSITVTVNVSVNHSTSPVQFGVSKRKLVL